MQIHCLCFFHRDRDRQSGEEMTSLTKIVRRSSFTFSRHTADFETGYDWADFVGWIHIPTVWIVVNGKKWILQTPVKPNAVFFLLSPLQHQFSTIKQKEMHSTRCDECRTTHWFPWSSVIQWNKRGPHAFALNGLSWISCYWFSCLRRGGRRRRRYNNGIIRIRSRIRSAKYIYFCWFFFVLLADFRSLAHSLTFAHRNQKKHEQNTPKLHWRRTTNEQSNNNKRKTHTHNLFSLFFHALNDFFLTTLFFFYLHYSATCSTFQITFNHWFAWPPLRCSFFGFRWSFDFIRWWKNSSNLIELRHGGVTTKKADDWIPVKRTKFFSSLSIVLTAKCSMTLILMWLWNWNQIKVIRSSAERSNRIRWLRWDREHDPDLVRMYAVPHSIFSFYLFLLFDSSICPYIYSPPLTSTYFTIFHAANAFE